MAEQEYDDGVGDDDVDDDGVGGNRMIMRRKRW